MRGLTLVRSGSRPGIAVEEPIENPAEQPEGRPDDPEQTRATGPAPELSPEDPPVGLSLATDLTLPVFEPAPTTTIPVELIGSQLRAAGTVDIGRFTRLTDYVDLLDGFFELGEATLLTRGGGATRVTLADLRIRLDEVMLVGQKDVPPMEGPADRRIAKRSTRLVVMTPAHVIYGSAYIHAQASLTAFVDAIDPRFIPMTNVRVRWLVDRRLTGRYSFALLQRRHIIGVATDGQRLEQL